MSENSGDLLPIHARMGSSPVPGAVPFYSETIEKGVLMENPEGKFVKIYHELRDCSLDTLRQISEQSREAFERELPNERKHEALIFQSLYFGGLILKPEFLSGGADAVTGREKFNQIYLSAVTQQRLVLAMFAAARDGTNPEFTKKIFDVVAMQEGISNSPHGAQEGYRTFWNGVRAQATAEKTLEDLGHIIFQPRTEEDDPDEPNEAVEWDVWDKVDFVSAFPDIDGRDTLLLIDVKGRAKYEGDHKNAGEVRRNADIDFSETMGKEEIEDLSESLQEFIGAFETPSVFRVKMTIPTSPEYVTSLTRAYREAEGSYQQTIQNLLTLPAYNVDEISQQIDNKFF